CTLNVTRLGTFMRKIPTSDDFGLLPVWTSYVPVGARVCHMASFLGLVPPTGKYGLDKGTLRVKTLLASSAERGGTVSEMRRVIGNWHVSSVRIITRFKDKPPLYRRILIYSSSDIP
ncbi:MAG: hypothetical protein LN414_04585, partial [Candidatus Thermoplasmatota archaeon]|nr:hypothetical protein [Candidatus Thermoplasmatota archaeon]